MDQKFVKTACSYCGSESITMEQYEENFEKLTKWWGRTSWQPIETAPKDNNRLLYLARFSEEGNLQELDFNGAWEYWQESYEMPHINGYYWCSANGIEEPTHWAYQDEPIPQLQVGGNYWRCSSCHTAHTEDYCPSCGHNTREQVEFDDIENICYTETQIANACEALGISQNLAVGLLNKLMELK